MNFIESRSQEQSRGRETYLDQRLNWTTAITGILNSVGIITSDMEIRGWGIT